VAILLTYATARILLAGDAEAREEEYMAGGPYRRYETLIKVPKPTHNLSQGCAPSCWPKEPLR
jgi:beta-lactamase superfamily II metal-dependent hydrolase